MPDKEAIERAKKDKREGKSASTQAGEFVREEIEHVREGKHGARSTEQAIAIGLSEARRAGVDVPKKGKAAKKSKGGRKTASKKSAAKNSSSKRTSAKRSRASSKALKREGHSAASKKALSKHARKAARKRTSSQRSAAAKKAARTKGAKGRSAAARKAARTRAKKRK
jgi:hypothetical protein